MSATQPERDALEACPFCGGEAAIVDCDPNEHTGGLAVSCLHCMACSRVMYPLMDCPRADLAELWNRRAPPATGARPAGWQWTHERDAELLARDGWMCEQHPGRDFPHDDCAGPGMAWRIEGRKGIVDLARQLADAREALILLEDEAADLLSQPNNKDYHKAVWEALHKARAVLARAASAGEKT